MSSLPVFHPNEAPVEKAATILRFIGAITVAAFFVPQLVDVIKDKQKSQCLNDLFLLGKMGGTVLVILGMLLAGGITKADWKRKDWIIIALFIWTLANYIIFYIIKVS